MREEKAVTLLYCWHVLAEEAKAEQLSARIYETYHLDLRTFTNTPVRDEAGISLELFSGRPFSRSENNSLSKGTLALIIFIMSRDGLE